MLTNGHEVFVIGLDIAAKSSKTTSWITAHATGDFSVSLKTGKVRMNGGAVRDWMLELVDTDIKTEPDQETGGISEARPLCSLGVMGSPTSICATCLLSTARMEN
jgi:hypothetical protein